MIGTYAILGEDGVTVVNVAVCDDPEFAASQGWVAIGSDPGDPGIGWTTPDGGALWSEPAPPDLG